MPTKISMRFVINSSVMQAPGPDHPSDERPGRCREFLHAVYHLCHRVVVTDRILTQWRQRANDFANKWLVRMGRRQKVVVLRRASEKSLQRAVESLEVRNSDLKLMLNDLFLIEAALATDRIVVSLDDEARRLFRAASDALPELERIIWVNAGLAKEDAAGWIRRGVQPEERRMLGRTG